MGLDCAYYLHDWHSILSYKKYILVKVFHDLIMMCKDNTHPQLYGNSITKYKGTTPFSIKGVLQ
jgi:predicted ferric reductase